MIRILLIRHGATDLLGHVLYGRMPGVHLNAEGQRQAEAAAEAVKSRYRLSEVISSPMERATQTAECIAHVQGLGVTIEEDVNEIRFGGWMGKSFSELADTDEWKQYNRHRSMTSPPGGESMIQVQTRAWNALEKIIARYRENDGASVAVVSHGDVVRGLLLLLLGMPIDHLHRLEVSPASVSEVLFTGGHVRIGAVNQVY